MLFSVHTLKCIPLRTCVNLNVCIYDTHLGGHDRDNWMDWTEVSTFNGTFIRRGQSFGRLGHAHPTGSTKLELDYLEV